MSEQVAVRERPILFSGPMVRAILDGRKTQTRRMIKPQPVNSDDTWQYGEEVFVSDDAMQDHLFHEVYGTNGTPYGSLYEGGGDRLWVRETFRETWDMSERPVMEYRAGGTRLIDGKSVVHGEHQPTSILPKWRPSIFMPRWASRITLEITDVRVERLQDISNEDARAEGVMPLYAHEMTYAKPVGHSYDAVPLFKRLWCEINGKDSWDANPWVWAISFKRV